MIDWIIYGLIGLAVIVGCYQLLGFILSVRFAYGFKFAFHTFVIIALVLMAGITNNHYDKLHDSSILILVVYVAGLLIHRNFFSTKSEEERG